MSLSLLLAFAVLVLDAWALDRVWGPPSPHRGRIRRSAAILLVPVVGAVLYLRRPQARPEPAPPPAAPSPQ